MSQYKDFILANVGGNKSKTIPVLLCSEYVLRLGPAVWCCFRVYHTVYSDAGHHWLMSHVLPSSTEEYSRINEYLAHTWSTSAVSESIPFLCP